MDLQMMGVWSSQFASQVADTRDRLRYARIVAREYKRDADGQFSSGGGDDDEGPDLGEHGFGVAPDGSSYSEHDVDEGGNPRFSQSYRDKYGSIASETTLGSDGLAFVEPGKGKLHVADDSDGTKDREVVQEFTKPQARELGAAVYGVYSGMVREGTTKSGVNVKARSDDPRRDGVEVTFASGRKVSLEGEAGDDGAFGFQEVLDMAADG